MQHKHSLRSVTSLTRTTLVSRTVYSRELRGARLARSVARATRHGGAGSPSRHGADVTNDNNRTSSSDTGRHGARLIGGRGSPRRGSLKQSAVDTARAERQLSSGASDTRTPGLRVPPRVLWDHSGRHDRERISAAEQASWATKTKARPRTGCRDRSADREDA